MLGRWCVLGIESWREYSVILFFSNEYFSKHNKTYKYVILTKHFVEVRDSLIQLLS